MQMLYSCKNNPKKDMYVLQSLTKYENHLDAYIGVIPSILLACIADIALKQDESQSDSLHAPFL